VNVSLNPPVSAHGAARQLLTLAAGRTNFGSAFESTERIEDGISVPLVQKVCSAGVLGYDALPLVTVKFAERTEIEPEHVEPTPVGVTRKNRTKVSLPRTRRLPVVGSAYEPTP